MKKPSRRSPLYLLGLLITTFLLPGIKKGMEEIIGGQIKDKGIVGVLRAARDASTLFVTQHPYLSAAIASATVSCLAIWYIYWWLFEKNVSEDVGESKERAYLDAIEDYMETLNQTLRYDQREFTSPGGHLLARELIRTRFLFRESSDKNNGGLRPRDIITLGQGSYIKSVVPRVLQSRQPILLLGDPGSGKSITLRQIALELGRRAKQRRTASRMVPIYISLGAYTGGGTHAPISILKFIEQQLTQVIPGGANIAPDLEKMLLQGRIALLFDSMDEMPRADFPDRANELKKFIIAYATRNRIVVACRDREYTGVLAYSELVILPFNDAAIKIYLKKNWQLYHAHLPAERQEKGYSDLLKIAAPTHALHALAANPYFLKLSSLYFFTHNGKLPASQAELLNGYIERRLQDESERKRLKDEDVQMMTTALATLAFELVATGRGTFFTRDDLSAPIAGDKQDEIADRILESGLLKQALDGSLRFEHHRLQEFLAALYWEQVAGAQVVTAAHLENPWWRETLTIRAGVTQDISRLLSQIIDCIDDSYLARIRLKRGSANVVQPPEERETGDIVARLNYLTAYELAMACATQRWAEVAEPRREELSLIGNAIVKYGEVLEKVRLARSLSDTPIVFSGGLFARLVGDDNDWVVSEAMASLSPREAETPEYDEVMRSFLRHAGNKGFRMRVDVLRHIVRAGHIRPEMKSIGLIGAYLRAVGIDFIMVAAYIFLTRYYGLMDQRNLIEKHYIKFGLGLGLLMGNVYWFAGGFQMWVAFSVFALALIFIDPQVAWLIMMGLVVYLWTSGEWFRRAIWITPEWKRLCTLFPVIPWLAQVVVTANLASALLMLIGWRVIGSPLSALYWFYPGIGLGLIMPIIVEQSCVASVGPLLAGVAHAGGDQEGMAILDQLIGRLKQPLSRKTHIRILTRITTLPLNEEVIIRGLYALTASSQFFLPEEEVLRAIDRLDLRRKQKELGSERGTSN